jgi:hypothetical protein
MRKAVAKCTVTKIHGQSMNQDIDHLDDELTAIVSSFPSKLEGGLHGHMGLVKIIADYDAFALGTPFVPPPNSGRYPRGNIPAAQRGQREAEHKALIAAQFQICVGVSKGLKDLILQAVDEDFLLELQAEGIAYLNVTQFQMLTHCGEQWILSISCHFWLNVTHHGMPQKFQQSISIGLRKLKDSWRMQTLVKALKSFKDAGNFDAAIREWEARPVATQTYANLKVVMCAEFSKLNQQDAATARVTGHASVNNVMEEIAQATEELVAKLTEWHTKQVESLIKSNSEAIKKLTTAILAQKPAATGTAAGKPTSKAAKAVVWAEKKRTATTCLHCNLKHPNPTHDQCWELPANAAKRPANWKSVKST